MIRLYNWIMGIIYCRFPDQTRYCNSAVVQVLFACLFCHYHSQPLYHGNWRGCSSLRRDSIHRCSSGDNAFFGISNGTQNLHKTVN
ncbi:unnamed protein product [Brassica oleracea]